MEAPIGMNRATSAENVHPFVHRFGILFTRANATHRRLDTGPRLIPASPPSHPRASHSDRGAGIYSLPASDFCVCSMSAHRSVATHPGDLRSWTAADLWASHPNNDSRFTILHALGIAHVAYRNRLPGEELGAVSGYCPVTRLTGR
jgi:hypothetical protein